MKIVAVNDYQKIYGPIFEPFGEVLYHYTRDGGIGDLPVFPPNDKVMYLFVGGADVSPSYYRHPLSEVTYPDFDRDTEESMVFNSVFEERSTVGFHGICRGGQFLNVMCGGTLVQDIKGHGGQSHDMCLTDGRVVRVNSLHHQMMVPNADGVVIGWTPRLVDEPPLYLGDPKEVPESDVEIVSYPDRRIMCTQYHPELMAKDSEGYKFYQDLVFRTTKGDFL